MKRDIVATISFSAGTVALTVLERLATNTVEVFNDAGDVKTANAFLSSAVKKVEKIIGAKLVEVGIIIEPSKHVDAKVDLYRNSINVAGDSVSQLDINNIVDLAKKNYPVDANHRVVFVQPLKYEVHDLITKSYAEAPLHKKGKTLFVSSAVTVISNEVYDYVNQVAKSLGLSISQILLSTQSISQNHLSENALASGAILINVSENQSFVTINKNKATVAFLSIYDYGFKNLIAAIAQEFGCSKQEAKDLLAAHGSFRPSKRIIYTYQMGLKQKLYAQENLTKIIKGFMTSLLVVIRKFLQQKHISGLPIVVSGKIWKIEEVDEFVKDFMQETYVSVYNPTTFVETNEANVHALGLIRFMGVMDKVMGRVYNTIIETNPGTLASLKAQSQTNKSLFAKLFARLGGYRDWE